MTDGWSNILFVSLEEWVVFNRFLNDQHTKDSKHGNTSVLCLSLTPLKHGTKRSVLGETKGVELSNGSKTSRQSPSKFIFFGLPSVKIVVDGGGDTADRLGSECSSRAEKGGEDGELHDCCFWLVIPTVASGAEQ
jgi:hypothetical protein